MSRLFPCQASAGGAPSAGILSTDRPEFTTPATYFEGLSTDLPGDFGVFQGGVTVMIPAGATTLWVAISDSFFGDNTGTLAVVITKLPH